MTAVREIMRPVLSHVLRSPFDPSISGLEGAVRYLLTEKYASAPAAWYDTQDFSTMFQDVAMTIPAALEQPVAIQLDKSGRGWHRSQATATKRPVLSRRVNLALATEDASSANWVPPLNATVAAASAAGAPLVSALWAVTETATSAVHVVGTTLTGVVSGATYTISYIMKAGARTWARIFEDSGTSFAYFNLSTGEIGTPSNATANIVSLGNGFYRCSLTYVQSGTVLRARTGPALNNGAAVYAGDGQIGLYVSGVQIEPGPLTSYQRVTTATDYDADPSKFPAYLSIDGVDDAYVTATQTGWDTTSAVTVFAALQRFDNAAAGMAAELGADASAGSGWALSAPPSAAANTMQMLSNGGTAASATAASAAAYKGILTGRANILAPSVQARFNGVAGTAVTTTQGAGPYANNAVNWFARNQSTIYFKGNAFGEIVIGAQMLDTEVALIEKYLAMKAGVTL